MHTGSKPVEARISGTTRQSSGSPKPLLICFSHLRWNFVFQRPQHLMTRFTRTHTVIFFEEPLEGSGSKPDLLLSRDASGVIVAQPVLPTGLDEAARAAIQRRLVQRAIAQIPFERLTLWYYTPMALAFMPDIAADLIVYDCMDELSAFRDAPANLRDNEAALFRHADLVFTGGQSLFEAKRSCHPNIYAFPSSVDVPHFAQARGIDRDPPDQSGIKRPRLGFFGVIDERMDVDLLRGIAEARSDWQLVMIGPVVKIEEASLPRLPNIHYLGSKTYAELPSYLAGWDIALLPFAQNESTRFISPTKTPEYLAAARPVIATPVLDVVRPYGELGLVEIAGDAAGFVAAGDALLRRQPDAWLGRVDAFLGELSWDRTWSEMAGLMERASRRWRTAENVLSPSVATNLVHEGQEHV